MPYSENTQRRLVRENSTSTLVNDSGYIDEKQGENVVNEI